MSQPFDNRDYDVQKLAEKDAEIERLKEENKGLEDIYNQVDYDVQKLAEKDAEVERLKEVNLSYSSTVGVQEREITRLQKLIGCRDAEIERLKEENKGLEDIYDQDCVTLQEQGDQIERLKAANLALGNEVKLQERENQRVEADNEILRKLIGELAEAELAHAEENLYKAGVRLGVMSVQLGNRDKLIGELAGALEGLIRFNRSNCPGEVKLIERAMELIT